MLRLFLAVALLALIVAGCDSNDEIILQDTEDSSYQVGQILSYRTRPGEEGSLLVITKVEKAITGDESQVIVHVFIDGLHIPHPEGGEITEIKHLAFTEAALNRSIIMPLERSSTLPDFESGYELWRDAFLKGEADVLDVTVTSAINDVAASLSE